MENDEILITHFDNDDVVKYCSDSGSETEGGSVSTADFINNECLEFIGIVLRSLSYIMEFSIELLKEYQDKNINMQLTNVFCDIPSLYALYSMISKKITDEKGDGTFCLPSVFLDEEIKSCLNVYKSFLSQYAVNAKWIGDFIKDNCAYQDICVRIKTKMESLDIINLDSCLYTVFNSLFSLALLFNRYSKCFIEGHESRLKGIEVENLISDLLNDININQKQMFCAQKELSLLTGKSKSPKINTRFICKNVVTILNKKGEGVQRQLVAFSDCIYVTLLPGTIIGTSKVKDELSLNNMIICETAEDKSKGTKYKYGLNINAQEGDYDFFFEDESTMVSWKDMLQSITKDYVDGDVSRIISISKLGEIAPKWQKDSAAGFCNGLFCSQRFTPTLRRHHCRADGLLYCDSCCSFKIRLKFSKSSESKVCHLCYRILNKEQHSPQSISEAQRQLESVFQLKTRKSAKSGWLEERIYNREKSSFNSPVKYFCELDYKDPYLNLFEKFEDKVKHHGIMLLGMDIKTNISKYCGSLKANQFTIEHQDKDEAYLFKTGSAEYCERWVMYLRESITNYFNSE